MWPGPSETAETQLLRRDGDDVLFLNELRNKKGTALRLRIPADDLTRLAAQAARGASGFISGTDYQGEPVIGYASKIPGTDWFMLAKISEEEVHAPIRQVAFTVALVSFLLLAIASIALFFWWRNRNAQYRAAQLQSELRQQLLTQQFDYLTRYANDIILLLGEGGNIVEANERAETAYGLSRQELLGRHVRQLRSPAESALVEKQWQNIRENKTLLFESCHIRSDGTLFPVEVNSRLIETEQGIFVQSIIRDITERKAAQARELRLTNIYRALGETNKAIIHLDSQAGLFPLVCRIVVEYGGMLHAWIGVPDSDGRFAAVAGHGILGECVGEITVLAGRDAPEGRGAAGTSYRESRTVVIHDVLTNPMIEPWREQSRKYGVNALAVCPILRAGTPYAVLQVYSDQADAFDMEIVQLLNEMAANISFALDNFDREAVRQQMEIAVRESEYRWKFAVKGSGDGLWDLIVPTSELFLSRGWKEMLGFADGELENSIKTCQMLFHPDDKAGALAAFNQLLYGSSSTYANECRMKCKDGSWKWVLDRGTVVSRDAAGNPLRLIGMQSDISGRKAAEARIQRLTQLYAALSHCNQAIVRCTGEEALFPEICRVAVQFGGMKMAWIGMLDPDGGLIRTAASSGMSPEYLDGIKIAIGDCAPSERDPIGVVVREDRPIWCQDFSSSPFQALLKERAARHGWSAVAALPLHRRGVVAGVFTLYAGEVNAFDENAQGLLGEMARDISFALDNFDRDAEHRKAELERVQILERYQAVVDSITDGVIIFDTEGRIISMNPVALRMHRHSSLEQSHRHLDEFQNEFDLFNAQGRLMAFDEWPINRLLRGENVFELEVHRCLRTTGEQLIQECNGSLIRNDDNEVVFGVLTIRDITDRKLAEQSLRESEARYSILFQDNAVVMMLVDPADGRIVNANVQASGYYGWDSETLKSMCIYDINTLSREKLQPQLVNALRNNRHFNFRHRLASGEVRDVESFVGSVSIGGRKLLLTSIHDIKERKQAEQALRDSETFKMKVLDSLVEHVTVIDSKGFIVSVNRSWLRFAQENGASGLALDWLGMNYLDISDKAINHDFGEEADAALSGIRSVLSGEKSSFSLEYPCHSPTEQRWFVMHVTSLQGPHTGAVVAHENITQQKKTEIEIDAARIRMAELSTKLIDAQEQERKNLARELHDELGQRFTTLNINLHHMRGFLSGDEAERTWSQASSEVASLIQHVRVMSGSLRPPMLDYFGLETAARQLLQQHFSNTRISHVFEYAGLPKKLPGPVEITAYRVIQEGITNVVRHADATHVIVEINGGESGDELEIIIRDNGKGFDPRRRNAFTQGSGFGLTGMRERVNLLGGTFAVESEDGQGTRIEALLSLK
jgi:PAS domain S-box-containing protein